MATDQEFRDFVDGVADLEAARGHLEATYGALVQLLRFGAARCEEIKGYNDTALMVWNFQRRVMADMLAGGVQGLPASGKPPLPKLFALKGKTGTAALAVTCTATQTFGYQDVVLVVDSQDLPEGATTPETDVTLGAIGLFLKVIIVAGVTIAASAVAAWFYSSDAKVKVEREQTTQLRIAAQNQQWTAEYRAEVFLKCLGIDPKLSPIEQEKAIAAATPERVEACRKASVEVVPPPVDLSQLGRGKLGGGGWSLLSKIALGCLVAGLTIGGLYFWKRRAARKAAGPQTAQWPTEPARPAAKRRAARA